MAQNFFSSAGTSVGHWAFVEILACTQIIFERLSSSTQLRIHKSRMDDIINYNFTFSLFWIWKISISIYISSLRDWKLATYYSQQNNFNLCNLRNFCLLDDCYLPLDFWFRPRQGVKRYPAGCRGASIFARILINDFRPYSRGVQTEHPVTPAAQKCRSTKNVLAAAAAAARK